MALETIKKEIPYLAAYAWLHNAAPCGKALTEKLAE